MGLWLTENKREKGVGFGLGGLVDQKGGRGVPGFGSRGWAVGDRVWVAVLV